MQKNDVRTLFDSIASRYDLLNHLLSGGIDYYWRRKAIDHLRDLRPVRVLDVATGTADFAIAAMRLGPERIVGVDIAEEMLRRGREKLASKGLTGTITLSQGEAEHLQFPDGEFDAAIVAFGARNFEHLERGLAEMRRVLRNGGMAVVLEFSRPRRFPVAQLYFFYFRRILPLVGNIISKNAGAYAYLPSSVMEFPDGDSFLRILAGAGFTSTTAERLTFGIATIYTGIK